MGLMVVVSTRLGEGVPEVCAAVQHSMGQHFHSDATLCAIHLSAHFTRRSAAQLPLPPPKNNQTLHACALTPQVLPPDMMLLAEPSPEDLLAAVEAAILKVPHLDPQAQHKRVRSLRRGYPGHETPFLSFAFLCFPLLSFPFLSASPCLGHAASVGEQAGAELACNTIVRGVGWLGGWVG